MKTFFRRNTLTQLNVQQNIPFVDETSFREGNYLFIFGFLVRPRANEYAFGLTKMVKQFCQTKCIHKTKLNATANTVELQQTHGIGIEQYCSLPTAPVSLLLVQDNHNQDADGDHDDDDVGDYGPFNSKHIQYNSSYDRILRKQICLSPPPTPLPPPHHLPNPACMGYKSLKISKIPNRYKISNKLLNYINYSTIPCNFTLLCATLRYFTPLYATLRPFTLLYCI